MKILTFSIVIIFVFFSCTKSKEQNTNAYSSEEKFADSLNVGLKGKTKDEIEKFKNDSLEDNLIIINFYKQDSIWDFKGQKNTGNIWTKTNRFYFDKDGITGIDAV